ncbi:PepSY-associated TM helix domain-containing protein [Jeotgalicoccus meleagridis]|uniref:PepSY-associated TM helix n=1 Tax=Jeotgalicoccus meleagridis TaxID=2759181 RepID=A0A6V7R1N9_9STAP|nr:PepSY domain-containing protein [Jeotgalicoccus meleagridis]CAD2071257.1 hypothetical protein JEODO184_00181 [Jeotgalicoccus meleagridis]
MKKKAYPIVWRWHLFAGIIIAPFLIFLAVTGALYLFKADIEEYIYKDYYYVEDGGDKLPASDLAFTAEGYAGGGDVVRYRPGEDANRSVEVGISQEDGTSLTVFINPYNRQVLGMIDDDKRPMAILELLHGELKMGTFGDRIVELVACWTIIMIISGLFLWYPRAKEKIKGVFTLRLKKPGRLRRRDLHAVPAFWLSGGLLFFLFSGLLWTGFWGNGVQSLVTASGAGYPPSIWVGPAPESDTLTEDIADVSWVAEKLPVQNSDADSGFKQVSIDDVLETINTLDVDPNYDVFYPSSKEGVFTLSVFPDQASNEATIHIDQYTADVIADYRYDNYGILGKVMATMITIHKGHEFGLLNQALGLLICLGLIFMVITGFYLWWKRKPQNNSGAPKAVSILEYKRILIVLIILGLIFPLVGISLLVVFLLDRFILRRFETLRKWLNY